MMATVRTVSLLRTTLWPEGQKRLRLQMMARLLLTAATGLLRRKLLEGLVGLLGGAERQVSS